VERCRNNKDHKRVSEANAQERERKYKVVAKI
jgi:hypothetical protein